MTIDTSYLRKWAKLNARLVSNTSQTSATFIFKVIHRLVLSFIVTNVLYYSGRLCPSTQQQIIFVEVHHKNLESLGIDFSSINNSSLSF